MLYTFTKRSGSVGEALNKDCLSDTSYLEGKDGFGQIPHTGLLPLLLSFAQKITSCQFKDDADLCFLDFQYKIHVSLLV